MPEVGYAAIVLAGGSGRRVSGRAKPLLGVGGEPMLHRVLAAAGAARQRIVVGPASLAPALPRGVALTSEQPPGGGPVAAIAAGLELVPATIGLVAALAADQPFLTADAVEKLLCAVRPALAGATYVDAEGRRQLGCAVWRADVLRRRLAELGSPAGAALHRLAGHLALAEVTWAAPAGPPPWYDCDTEDDLARAEEWAHGDAG